MFECAVVGGGIVGVASALAIARRIGARGGGGVLLLEKERALAMHQSSHNSGVIHAGVYYQPGSLRAELCVRGARLMYEFAAAHDVAHRRCGKLIVAVRDDELGRLDTLHQRALANGVRIRRIERDEVRAIEPAVTRAVAALHAADSGVIEYRDVVLRLASLFEAHSAANRLLLGFELAHAERLGGAWRLRSTDGDGGGGEVRAKVLVTCAGLWSDRVAQLCGASPAPAVVPVRGEWRLLRPPHNELVRGLIYPVPDPKFPFLGVHFTRRLDGSVLVGPNAMLATARDGYSPRDVRWRDVAALARHDGVRALVRRELAFGAGELLRSVSRRAHARELVAYMPELRPAHLSANKLTGVRAQAMGADGKLHDDFILDEGDSFLHVRNAPSPAATASLAIADYIADRVMPLIER